jgi:LemA protein
MGALIFLVVILLVAAVFFVNLYNRLVAGRNRYQNAYAQIDVQLRRRYDLIPNLVESVKGYMAHERDTLAAVINARNSALGASRRAAQAPGDPRAMEQLSTAEGLLDSTLGRFFALAEAYPDLKANQTMAQLIEELRSTENRIAFARQAFNDAVTLYNTQREMFPGNLLASSFNFTPAQLLEESAPEVKAVPRVSFS